MNPGVSAALLAGSADQAVDFEVDRVPTVIVDRDDPYHYAEVRGRVVETVTGNAARDHITHLSYRYDNRPYDDARIKTERVILKIAPERQRVY